MSAVRPHLDVRPLELEDETDVLRLLTDAMSGGPTGERNADFFRWKHRNSPFGASPGLVAVHDGRVVGVRLFLRWSLSVDGRTVRAVRAVDTATHPDYQRQGIFKRLTLELLGDLEARDEVDLVFNTPNADSLPGYLRMGWREVGVLPVHLSPVRPMAFLRGLRQASRATAAGRPEDVVVTVDEPVRSPLPDAARAFDGLGALSDLLARTATSSRLHTARTLDYLRWRYADVPGLDYRCVPVERDGRLVGLGIGRVRRRAGLAELTLGEVIVGDGDARAARAVLGAARRSGVDHVTVHAAPGTEVADQLWRRGYVRPPGRGITLVANPRRDIGLDAVDPASWRLSLGDLEVF